MVRQLDTDPEDGDEPTVMDWQGERREGRRLKRNPGGYGHKNDRVGQGRAGEIARNNAAGKESWKGAAGRQGEKMANAKPLPAAIVARANEGTTYADVLKKVKKQEYLP